jgi:PAS domain S-box-containing protein
METLERVNDLYHKAPCGYHSLDPNGVFVEINDTALQWLGYQRDELIGKMTVFDVQAPESRKEKQEAFERLRKEGAIENLEIEFIRKDGSTLPVLLSASCVRDAKGNFVRTRSTFIDVTARKQAERALRQTEARLQAILDNTPEIIFLKDLEGRYLHYNRQFEQTFHVARGAALGKTDFDIFPKNNAESFRSHDRQVIESGQAIQFEEVTDQEDGPHVSIVSKFPIHDPDGNIYAVGGIVTDVTERKRLEAEVLRISEHEQQRIAQDLHDGLGQQLAGTWFLSDTLRKNLVAQSSPEEPTASKIVHLLETAVSQTRSLARGLYPVPQQPDGLMAGLEDLAANLSELFNVNCRFECPQPVLIPDYKLATNFYRIAQEAAANAIKHGKARLIKIQLFATDAQLVLKITDDGSGIRRIPKGHKGMGLRTMNYRAELIGADFAIRRASIRGTEVVCSVRKP